MDLFNPPIEFNYTIMIKDLDFSWATDDIDIYEKKPILHMAGVTDNLKHCKFYKGELKADDSVKNTLLSYNEEETFLHTPVDFIDTSGCSFDDIMNPESLSHSNPDEATLLIKHLKLRENKDFIQILAMHLWAGVCQLLLAHIMHQRIKKELFV